MHAGNGGPAGELLSALLEAGDGPAAAFVTPEDGVTLTYAQLAGSVEIGGNQIQVIDLDAAVVRLGVQEIQKRSRAMLV